MKMLHWTVAVGLMVLAVGCATTTTYDVQSDHDPSADFTALKTFDWLPSPEDDDVDDLALQRIQTAVNAQLTAKGLSRSTDAPDFLVAAHVGKEEKVDVTDWGYAYGQGVRYGDRIWSPGGLEVFQYEEGSLILDFVDPESKQLIWRGSGKAQLTLATTEELKETVVNDAVASILDQFPPQL